MTGKRNIILIHLESLNLLRFRMNSEWFPNLKKWEEKSLSFSNYYSTATSTLMVMSDLAFGGVLRNEKSRGLLWKGTEYAYSESIVDKLEQKGYRTLVIECPTDNDYKSMEEKNFVGSTSHVESYSDYKEYEKRIEEYIKQEEPFFLWDINCISCTSCNYLVEQEKGKMMPQQRWEESFRIMDEHVGKVMSYLEDRGSIDNATVILYGDHGDDIYTHGKNGGLTHALVPYPTMTHTPMFIYDARIKSGIESKLISTTDITRILEGLIEDSSIMDIISDGGSYAVSRSLFAAQLSDGFALKKGYSVTDGRYYLLIEEAGMSLFNLKADPTGHHNLLDYFDYIQDELVLNEGYCRTLRFHFPYLFDNHYISEVEHAFYSLREWLMYEIRKLYEYADRIGRKNEINSEEIAYGIEAKEYREESGELHESIGVNLRYFNAKKTVIYGAGRYGTRCYDALKDITDIVAWVDQNYESKSTDEGRMQVAVPSLVLSTDYDIVLIAIKDLKIKQEVLAMLIEMGVPENKIL